MAARIRLRELERALEAVPPHPAPRADLEQVPTPPRVAAELLHLALGAGDIADRRVLDLGCGTGVLSLAALLCGAAEVTGVEVDAASLEAAREAVARHPGAAKVHFVHADVRAWHPEGSFDTVVMNPPFGAQRAARHLDRVFYDRAREAVAPGGGAAWFLAQTRTEGFLAAYAEGLGARLEKVGAWSYPLPARFAFHSEAVRSIQVGGYRMEFAA